MIRITNNDAKRGGGALSKCKSAICIIAQPGLKEAQKRIRITWRD